MSADELPASPPARRCCTSPDSADWKPTERPPTPRRTLREAREIARCNGVRHAHTGNVDDEAGAASRCPGRFDPEPGIWGARRLPVRLAARA